MIVKPVPDPSVLLRVGVQKMNGPSELNDHSAVSFFCHSLPTVIALGYRFRLRRSCRDLFGSSCSSAVEIFKRNTTTIISNKGPSPYSDTRTKKEVRALP